MKNLTKILLGIAIFILVVVVIVGLSGTGVYPGFPLPTTQAATVTYQTNTGMVTAQTTVTSASGTTPLPACNPLSGAHQGPCYDPNMVFNVPGPLTTTASYCSTYENYYGVSYCPIGQSGGSSPTTAQLLPLSLDPTNPSPPLLLNLNSLFGVFVDIRFIAWSIVAVIILGAACVLSLIRRKRKK